MKVIVNDLSFQYKFYSREEALKGFMAFIEICHEIESGRLKNVEKLTLGEKPDVTFEIAPECKIIKLLQSVLPREERSYLLSIIMNRAVEEELPKHAFNCDGKASYACALAKDGAVVSLMSSNLFSKSIIEGKIENEKISLKNIACEKHVFLYRQMLGLRLYRANKEKHKEQRSNPYGKGKVASPMDLDDETAQKLLDRAIEYKGRLYGRYRGKNYSFQKEQDVYYHCYIDDTLGDDVLRALESKHWES